MQKVINEFSQVATESEWKKFLDLYAGSDDGPDPVAMVKCLTVVARSKRSSPVENEDSDEEPNEEESVEDPVVATKKRKAPSPSPKEKLPDEDVSWKEGDDEEEDEEEDDVEADTEEDSKSTDSAPDDEKAETKEDADKSTVPSVAAKRKNVPQKIVSVVVGSSSKRRKEAQNPSQAKRSHGAGPKQVGAASASDAVLPNVRRGTISRRPVHLQEK